MNESGSAPRLDINHAVDAYFAIWNESDADRRRTMITETYSDNATYLDPLLQADSPDDIHTMVAGVQTQFPGHVFRRTGPIDAHHGVARFPWELIDTTTETPLIAGIDIAQLASDGRFQSVVGFLDLVPEMPGVDA